MITQVAAAAESRALRLVPKLRRAWQRQPQRQRGSAASRSPLRCGSMGDAAASDGPAGSAAAAVVGALHAAAAALNAAAALLGVTPDPEDPLGLLKRAVCGACLLLAAGLALREALRRMGPPPAAPIYFRRAAGPHAGKVEPLAEYDGTRREAIYIAVKGRVFDVSSGAEYYGPDGGGYSALAGQDAGRALGIMSLQGREVWLEDCRIRRIDDLSESQLKVMKEWEDKYVEKYPIVGCLLGVGQPGDTKFVPAEGTLEEALAADRTATEPAAGDGGSDGAEGESGEGGDGDGEEAGVRKRRGKRRASSKR